jgi:N-succinyl-L-ornithine transcarbamylase
MQHFRNVQDVPDIQALVDLAFACKQDPRHLHGLGTGKALGMVMLNPSTRTRISTQLAAKHLGMEVVVFNADKDGWALEFGEDVIMNGTTVEHIREAAPVFGAYFDVLGLRSFPALQDAAADQSESILQQFVRYSGVPVVSLESATLHPLQSLADLMTIQALFQEKRKPRIALSWAPHMKPLPHCVANSFAQWITAWGGADFVIAHPEGYALDPVYTAGAEIVHDQQKALEGADFVYVKNWSATEPYGTMPCSDPSWMLRLDRLDITNNAKVMHCLPVRRNLELGADILDSTHSVVVQQASNRVWAAQAVLSQLLNQTPEKA